MIDRTTDYLVCTVVSTKKRELSIFDKKIQAQYLV